MISKDQILALMQSDARYLLPSRSEELYIKLLSRLKIVTAPPDNRKHLVFASTDGNTSDDSGASITHASIEILTWNRLSLMQNFPWRAALWDVRNDDCDNIRRSARVPTRFQPENSPHYCDHRGKGRMLPDSYMALRAEIRRRMSLYLGGANPQPPLQNSHIMYAPEKRGISPRSFLKNEKLRLREPEQKSINHKVKTRRFSALEEKRESNIKRMEALRIARHLDTIRREATPRTHIFRERTEHNTGYIWRKRRFEWMRRFDERRGMADRRSPVGYIWGNVFPGEEHGTKLQHESQYSSHNTNRTLRDHPLLNLVPGARL